MTPTKWDIFFLGLAEYYASASKDPSTKVGAVIVNGDNIVVGLGYNGFPRGIADDDRLLDRDTKLKHVIHGEMNAILNANGSVKGCSLYVWPFMSCDRCAAHVIQAGIVRVVAPAFSKPAWLPMFQDAAAMFEEAGVEAMVKLGVGTSGGLISFADYLAYPEDTRLRAA